MFTPVYTRQFEKDLKRCVRPGKNIDKFKILTRTLLSGEPLAPIHRDRLSSQFQPLRFSNLLLKFDANMEYDPYFLYDLIGESVRLVGLGWESRLKEKKAKDDSDSDTDSDGDGDGEKSRIENRYRYRYRRI